MITKIEQIQAELETLLGMVLTYTAFIGMMRDVYFISETIAAMCGAAIGIHGVWRIWGPFIRRKLHTR